MELSQHMDHMKVLLRIQMLVSNGSQLLDSQLMSHFLSRHCIHYCRKTQNCISHNIGNLQQLLWLSNGEINFGGLGLKCAEAKKFNLGLHISASFVAQKVVCLWFV